MTLELGGDALAQLQRELATVQYIIVDEYSMLSCELLSVIGRWLRQVPVRPLGDYPFGGFSVILFGDVAQLPCVKATPLFMKPARDCNLAQ